MLLSSDVNPERKEYERTSTTAIAAGLAPIVDRALGAIESTLAAEGLRRPLRVMKSNGGVMSARAARAKPVELVKSGPAGGAAAGAYLAEALGEPDLILLDIGGTTADASLIRDGRPARAESDAVEWDIPIRVPVVDIRSIGAGGGSIAWLDAAGGLRVGPDSAGAEPGPAAYGRGGTRPTVTDAARRGRPDRPGALPRRARWRSTPTPRARASPASPARSPAASSTPPRRSCTSRPARWRRSSARSPSSAASTRATSCSCRSAAPGRCSPARCSTSSGCQRAIVPAGPATLSALGGAFADVRFDYVRSESGEIGDVDPARLDGAIADLRARAGADLREEGFADAELAVSVDLRYAGQRFALELPLARAGELADAARRFEAEHERLYGHRRPERPVELVAVRVRASAALARPVLPDAPAAAVPAAGGAAASSRTRCAGSRRTVLERAALPAGFTRARPADRRGGPGDDRGARRPGAPRRPARRARGGAGVTRPLDAVLARVLARAFSSTCAEMGHATIRTAVSAVFVEGRDFSCALLDPRAELVAAANFDPSHLSAMALTAEYALMELGHEHLAEGDVIVVNDPYRGGGHLTDIAVLRPVFAEGELLGLAMNRGHHIDVGGMAVAGFPGTARSIFQEGMRIPPVKWFEGGVERRQVMDLILLNVRFPQAQLGDFQAQLASCVAAEQRVRALVERYGIATVRAAMQATKDHSERLMRHAIASIPDGAYAFADLVDDDGVGGGPYRIAVELRVEGDAATIDFAGTSAQADGPINSSYGNTIGSCFNAFLHAFGAGIDFNGGCFKPIRFAVPRGSFLNPVPPAPVFGGVTEVSIRVIDAISGALAQAVPGQRRGGELRHVPERRRRRLRRRPRPRLRLLLLPGGRLGRDATRDGWTSVPNPTSNFNDFPVEVLEEELPLRCLEVALHEGSGGAGRHRGGLGTRRTYELLADGCELNALGERFTVPPYGLAGGAPGRPNALLHAPAGEAGLRPFAERFKIRSPSKFAALPLRRGDRFALVTGGGGGYGDPRARPPEEVAT